MVDGQRVQGIGAGYHDHNWGDRPMAGAIHHWYWGRAVVEDFVIIAANLTPQPEYGMSDHTDLVLIKAGKVIAVGSQGMTFSASAIAPDPTTHKPLANIVTFTFIDGSTQYIATFQGKGASFARPLGEAAYHRCAAMFTLEVINGGTPTILSPVGTTYEMMWFGDQANTMGLDLYTSALVEPRAF